MMRTLMQDLRHGIRLLAMSPGFAAVAILTLGLGIGSTTTIFSVVNAVLFRALPFKDSERSFSTRRARRIASGSAIPEW